MGENVEGGTVGNSWRRHHALAYVSCSSPTATPTSHLRPFVEPRSFEPVGRVQGSRTVDIVFSSPDSTQHAQSTNGNPKINEKLLW